MFSVSLELSKLILKNRSCLKRCFSLKKERDKSCCIVNIFGNHNVGKTTIADALNEVSSKNFNFKLKEKLQTGSLNATYYNFFTNKTNIFFIDVPAHSSKNIISSSYGADVGIVVIDFNNGLCQLTKEHINYIKMHEIENLIVYINKKDLADVELEDLIIDEVYDYFKKQNLNLSKDSIITGSAKFALTCSESEKSILKILDLIEIKVNNISRKDQIEKPALFSIRKSHSKKNKGTEITGFLKQGILKRGDIVNIEGYDRLFKTKILEIESFNQQLDSVVPGQSVALLLKSIKKDDIRRGMVVYHPDNNIFTSTDQFLAEFKEINMIDKNLLKPDDNISLSLYSRTFNTQAILKLENSTNNNLTNIKLIHQMPLIKGLKFILKNNRLIALGVIKELLPSYENQFLEKFKK